MTVNICLITYNHENYIAEAIESILKQVVNFRIRIVIGEDCSTDRTRAICAEYAAKYPDIIYLPTAEGNIGMMKNFLRALKACEGKYIAFLEGDDYWTDPHKLQKQVDFLEQNPGFSACFHNVTMKSTRYNQVREWILLPKQEKDVFETEDLLRQWFIPSGSVVFANYPDFVLPDWFIYCKSGDIPFLLLLSLRGKFKYLDEVMGVYRSHDQGMAAAHAGHDKIIAMIFIYENFNIYTQFKYRKKIKEAMIYEIDYHSRENTERRRKLMEKEHSTFQKIYRTVRRTLTGIF